MGASARFELRKDFFTKCEKIVQRLHKFPARSRLALAYDGDAVLPVVTLVVDSNFDPNLNRAYFVDDDNSDVGPKKRLSEETCIGVTIMLLIYLSDPVGCRINYNVEIVHVHHEFVGPTTQSVRPIYSVRLPR